MMLRLRGGGHKSNPWKKAHSKMRWKWKKKRTRRLQRKRRCVPARPPVSRASPILRCLWSCCGTPPLLNSLCAHSLALSLSCASQEDAPAQQVSAP